MPIQIIPSVTTAQTATINYPAVLIANGLGVGELISVNIFDGTVYAPLLDDLGAPVQLTNAKNALPLPFHATYQIVKPITVAPVAVGVSTLSHP